MSGAADRRRGRSAAHRGADALAGLSEPRRPGRLTFGLHYDPEKFGRFSESVARFLGTARFLVIQTVLVFVWVVGNIVWALAQGGSLRSRGFDPYPFILLTLVLSLQAAYAAPLILLAQNRQEDRDRRAAENDREVAFRTQADTEFLARELASIRLALSDVVTADELDQSLERVVDRVVERALARRAEPPSADDPTGERRSEPRLLGSVGDDVPAAAARGTVTP